MKANFIAFQFLLVNYKLLKVEGHVADTFGLLPVEASTVSMAAARLFCWLARQ